MITPIRTHYASGRSDSCIYAKDGHFCDEKESLKDGPAEFWYCADGTDCSDCGNCNVDVPAPNADPPIPQVGGACIYQNNGICEEPWSCPYGTDVNDCAPANVALTTSNPKVKTTTEFQVQVATEAGTQTTTLQAPLVCTVKANNCHKCSIDSNECTMCRNGAYLYSGKCVGTCPRGTRSAGKGNFNKRCTMQSAGCVAKANDCYECSIDSSECTVCKNAAFLHAGMCIDACPPGTKSVGKGNFHKRCKQQRCVPKADNCHTCNAGNNACTVCKNAAFLHAGSCIAVCPPGTKSAGKGLFNKRCE